MMSAVPEASRTTLQKLLLSGYDIFIKRLTRLLGSRELAQEALQETYLRLERDIEIGPVRNPKGYLLRMAMNIASNRRKAEKWFLTGEETDLLLTFADEAPDPARAAEARSEIQALGRALEELPLRRRQIFMASWIDETPHQEIARLHGITIRTVQIELRDALEHCAQRLKKRKFRS
ncbi:MAG TPA: RNA polymerase sigma factor [Rhizomicrobium sp.]|jgi:RNA polymerase sigma-70 factor (ECF subfamily)